MCRIRVGGGSKQIVHFLILTLKTSNVVRSRSNVIEHAKHKYLGELPQRSCVLNMNRYKLLEEIGDGSFGRVMKAKNNETGEVVAVKHIKQKFKSWKKCVNLRR